MCGILLQLNFNKKNINRSNFYEMLKCLNHRGPDAEGIYYNQNIALGHKRLSIIDLSKMANQPMISKDKKHILVFNGEIYNFKQLKKKLQKKKYNFLSNSDTEVVLYALIEWGEKALLMFNGMFALCFYNKKENSILVARDRYGIKPLYCYNDGQSLVLSSESKAIFKYNKFKNDLNFKGIYEYFTFQNLISNDTFVKNLKIIEAGSYKKINLNTNNIYSQKYWDYKFSENIKLKTYEDYTHELNIKLKNSVKNHIISDVEIGSFLSGGIDSSIISSLSSKNLNNLKTFTCGFEIDESSDLEFGYDERKEAEYISSLIQSEQYEIVLKAGDLEKCIDDYSYAIEEPRIGQSYPNYYISKLAGKFVKVSMSGSGGDELFAGYPWRYFSATNSKDFSNYVRQYYDYWQRLLSVKEKKRLFKSNELLNIDEKYCYDLFYNIVNKADLDKKNSNNFVNFSLYFELKTFLHSLFIVEDKLSMAHGLETRVPFMDNDIVDFALNIPLKVKLHYNKSKRVNENIVGPKQKIYFQKTNSGKRILRRVAKKYFPPKVFNAQKKGFSAPDAGWFKNKSYSFIENLLLNKKSRINDFFNQKYVESIIKNHKNGRENRRLLIWSLISFENYLKKYF